MADESQNLIACPDPRSRSWLLRRTVSRRGSSRWPPSILCGCLVWEFRPPRSRRFNQASVSSPLIRDGGEVDTIRATGLDRSMTKTVSPLLTLPR